MLRHHQYESLGGSAGPRQKESERTREAMSKNHERTVFWKPMEKRDIAGNTKT